MAIPFQDVDRGMVGRIESSGEAAPILRTGSVEDLFEDDQAAELYEYGILPTDPAVVLDLRVLPGQYSSAAYVYGDDGVLCYEEDNPDVFKQQDVSSLEEAVDQNTVNRYFDTLIPSSGPAATVPGEILRAGNRIVYDLYNNGWGNYWRESLEYLKRMNQRYHLGIKDSLFNWLDLYADGRVFKVYRKNQTPEQRQAAHEKYKRARDRLDTGLMEPILQYLSKIDIHSPTLERNTFDSTMGKDIAPEDRVEPPKWEDVSDLEEASYAIKSSSVRYRILKALDESDGLQYNQIMVQAISEWKGVQIPSYSALYKYPFPASWKKQAGDCLADMVRKNWIRSEDYQGKARYYITEVGRGALARVDQKGVLPQDMGTGSHIINVADLEESVIVESRSLLPKGQTITFDWNFDGKVVPVTGVIQKILKDKKSINPAQKYLYQIKLTVPATVELRPGKTLTVKRTSMKNIQR